MLIWLDGAGGVFDGDPIDNVGISIRARERFGIVEGTKWFDRDNKREIFGGIVWVGNNDTAGIGAASLEREALAHRENGKNFFFHLYYYNRNGDIMRVC